MTATAVAPAGSVFRQFRTDLEVIRAKGSADDRIVRGIAVPWDMEAEIDGWLVESFQKGAVDHQMSALNRIKFSNQHMYLGGTPVGVTRKLKNDDAGLYGEWYVSATPEGASASPNHPRRIPCLGVVDSTTRSIRPQRPISAPSSLRRTAR